MMSILQDAFRTDYSTNLTAPVDGKDMTVEQLWLAFRSLYNAAINTTADLFLLLRPVYTLGMDGESRVTDFRIADTNAATVKRMDTTRDQMIDKLVGDVFQSVKIPGRLDTFIDAFVKQVVVSLDLTIPDEYPNKGFYHTTLAPTSNFLAITYREITGNKDAQQTLLELQLERNRIKTIQELIRDIGHDIRTPLAVISTSLYLAERNPESEARAAHVALAKEQVNHIKGFLDEMTRVTRMENLDSNKLRLTNINRFLERLITELMVLSVDKHQDIKLELQPSGTVFINEESMYRAVANIVRNAIAYTDKGGKIFVSTERNGNKVFIKIRDTGKGIAAEAIPHIFERYYRADANDDAEAHSGLGLSIAQHVVDSHGGTIQCESEVGVGTTFTIILPTANEDDV